MLGVNPFHDTLPHEESRFPAPFETGSVLEENPFPLSKEPDSPAIEISGRKNEVDVTEAAKACHKRMVRDEADPKEVRKFERQWALSDGFDVDYPPSGLDGSPVVCKDASDMNGFPLELIESARLCAQSAIDKENERKNSNLEFDELVKFNLDSGWGKMFYLTFIAKVKDGSPSVYQAKVFLPDGDDDDDEEESSTSEEEEDCEGEYIHGSKYEQEDFLQNLEDLEYEDLVYEEEEEDEDEDEEDEDEDEDEDEEDEDDKEEDEDEEKGDVGGGKGPKVLLVRVKPRRYKKKPRGGVEKKPERGQKRCRCGEKKEGCGKGGRSCCDGGSSNVSS